MRNQIELRHFRYFQQLAKDLHFRKASEKLYISQSALSKQIMQLEDYMDVKLFVRENKKVKLTKSGDYLIHQVEQLQNFITTSVEKCKAIDSGYEGEIKIGFVGSAMQNVIPKLIMQSQKKYPDLHFTLNEMSNTHQIESLQNNIIDLGFVRMNRLPKGLALHKVFTDYFTLVLPKNHKLTRRNFKSLAQCETEAFILFSSDYSSTYYEKIMSIFSDAGFQPKISHKSIHANTIFKLVESGLGVAIVPNALTEGFQLNIKMIPLKKIKQHAELYAAWNPKNHNNALENILKFITLQS